MPAAEVSRAILPAEVRAQSRVTVSKQTMFLEEFYDIRLDAFLVESGVLLRETV